MNQKGFANIILVVVIIVLAGVAGYFALVKKSPPIAQQTPTPTPNVEAQVRIAVEKVLSQGILPNPNEQMPKGIKLLSVSVVANKVTLNLSKEITSKGQGVFEDTLSLVSNAIHPIIQGEGKDPKYPELNITVLVEGKPLNKVSFTINADTITVKVYFRDSNVSPIYSCGVLAPVTRIIPKTEKVATAAITELLKGPTDAEKLKGYSTDIPSSGRLNSLVIVNGEARADFSSTTESGGSCNLTTDQISKTLLQFSTVKTVTLSVDGRTENIFQP